MTTQTPAPALTEAPEPSFTVQWENGVFNSYPIPAKSKPDAFRILDGIMSRAEYPSSIAIAILEDGKTVWHQHGTTILLNA